MKFVIFPEKHCIFSVGYAIISVLVERSLMNYEIEILLVKSVLDCHFPSLD